QMIIASKAPVEAEIKKVTNIPEPYMRVLDEREKRASEWQESAGSGSFDDAGGTDVRLEAGLSEDALSEDPVIMSMGQVIYGQLLNELNSDVPTPVLVHVLSGPLRGGRALGEFTVEDEYLVITF